MDDNLKKIWEPTPSFLQNTNLTKYFKWLKINKGLDFSDYEELWQWSVDHLSEFWETMWQYFDIKSHSPYSKVMSDDQMPNVKWFEGATLNYAEHIFRNKTADYPAIIYQTETIALTKISWDELERKVSSLQFYLQGLGVGKGDCVVGFLPNIPEATIAFLATNALGAIWSSCSPDFGAASVIDRFSQIEPKVIIAIDGYNYNHKTHYKIDVVNEIVEHIASLEKVIYIPFVDEETSNEDFPKSIRWSEVMSTPGEVLTFEPVPFDHPIWVLYSSGTTGIPKAITHSHGGILMEHLKYLTFQNDVHKGERFFWYSTTGWMMWNFVQGALLVGATIVLYDGSPSYPDLNMLWEFTEKAKINHFGTSAPYLVACMKREMTPKDTYDLSSLRSISSTGSPLPPEAFDWVYENVGKDIWLCSMSGGTDVCTAFVGGTPIKPLYQGEIQCRALGVDLHAFDEMGQPVLNEVGEMVILKAMPSMPIYFWNDKNNQRYLASYFEMYPNGVWRHGDWIKITDRGSLTIYGRSDATLNRQGIRIGTAEIYRAVNQLPEVVDSLIVNLEMKGGLHFMPLFVLLQEGMSLNDAIINEIKTSLKTQYTPRHVPDEIIQVNQIPYTISGKKLEAPVKKILMGIPTGKAANKDAMKNPESLEFFIKYARRFAREFEI